jgi:hypothetical protein
MKASSFASVAATERANGRPDACPWFGRHIGRRYGAFGWIARSKVRRMNR